MQTERDFRSELDALDETPTVRDDTAPAPAWPTTGPISETRRAVEPMIDRFTIKKQIEDEEKREAARQGSSPLWQEAQNLIAAGPAAYLAGKVFGRGEGGEGALGTIGKLNDAERQQWIADEKVSAERSASFWEDLRKNYGDALKRSLGNVIDYSPQGLIAQQALKRTGVIGEDTALGDEFGGWFDRKVGENIALAKRRRLLAEEMEAGVRAGPKFGTVRSTIDDISRGFSGIIGKGVKGVAYGIESGDLIKVNPLIDGYIVDTLKKAKVISGNPSEAQKRSIYQFGQYIEHQAEQLFPADEARAEEFRKKLAEGVGSMIAFMGAGYTAVALGKGAGVATIVSGVTGGLSQAGSMTDDALKKYLKDAKTEGRKLTPEEERKATQVWLMGLGIGATEAVPLASFFAGHSGRFVRGVLLQATEEGSQEWVQQVLENVVAQRYYDPGRKWDDNAWEGLAIGAILGSNMQAGQSALSKLRGEKEKPAEKPPAIKPPAAEGPVPDPLPMADVSPMLDGEGDGKKPSVRKGKSADPELDRLRQILNPSTVEDERPTEIRRVLGKGLEELASDGGPGDAIAKVAGVVSKKLETGQVPTFQEMLAALPKDERGDPDMGRLADELEKVGVRAWNGLNDDQRRQVYEAVAPVVQAVETDPRGAIEAVGDAVRTVVEAAGQPEPRRVGTSALEAWADQAAADAARSKRKPAAAPSAPASTADLRQAFDRVLSSRTKRADWAKTIGASKAQLDALVNEALADGRLKKTKAGGIARTGKKVAPPAPAPSIDTFAKSVIDSARSVGEGTPGRVGRDLVFINHAHTAYVERTGDKISLDQFKTRLFDAWKARKMPLAIANVLDPKMLAEASKSRIVDGRQEWHVIDLGETPATGKTTGQPSPESPPVPTLSPGQQTGRTMDRSAEKRLEAVKNPVARQYAQALLEGDAESALAALKKDRKVTKDVLDRIVKAYSGAKAPKTKAAGYDLIERLIAERAKRSEPALPSAPPPASSADLQAREDAARSIMESPEWQRAMGAGGIDTSRAPDFNTDEWRARRVYNTPDGQIATFDAARDYLLDKSLAGVPGGVANDRKVYVLLGLPGAGKSTIAGAIRKEKRAAHIVADDAKLIIPEYDGGKNSGGVHEESSLFADAMSAKAMQTGANIIIEKLGSSDASIARVTSLYKANGYRVVLIDVSVPKAIAMERAVSRWRRTGRAVPIGVYDTLNVPAVISIIESKGLIDEAAQVQWQEPTGWELTKAGPELQNLVIPSRVRAPVQSGVGGRDSGQVPGSGVEASRPQDGVAADGGRTGDGVREGTRDVSEGEPAGDLPTDEAVGGIEGAPEGDRGTSLGDVRGDGAPDDGAEPAGRAVPGEGEAVRGDAGTDPRDGDERSRIGRIIEETEAKVEADRADRASRNYLITDDDQIGQGGPKAKVRANIDAIRIVRTLEEEKREATEDERKALVKYVGWGAFAQDIFADYKPEWAKERQALKDLLSPEEYEAARRSTQNAHYTSPDVIKGMWEALAHLGFKGGRALEPSAGVGHFIGMMPQALRNKVEWTAVELDPTTGAIAKALYSGSDVRVQGFETVNWPDGFFDLAISNVPFGNYPIRDTRYKRSYNIHDYFFIKSLDKVRPGGIVAFITSAGTLDKASGAARKAMADRATFLGAIRLPGGKKGAFAGNAGTEVTTDIIFLRRRMDGEPQGDLSWLETKEIKTKDGPAEINGYFADNPDMMLGEMRLTGSMYGVNEPVLIGSPANIDAKIADAAKAMPADAFIERRQAERIEAAPEVDSQTDGIKEGAFYDKEGKLFRKIAGVGIEQKVAAAEAAKIRSFMAIRDTVNLLLSRQSRGDKTGLDGLRESLNAEYDAFVKTNGPINKTTINEWTDKKTGKLRTTVRRPNLASFRDDPDAYKVAAIENYDEQKNTASKTAIFTADIVASYERPKISGPADALAVSLNETGTIDMPRIAAMLDMSEAAAAEALGDRVYLNPNGDVWQTADLYLGGDVVTKLEEARAAAAINPDYARNIAALEAVQPVPLTRDDIFAPMGAPWIPAADYEAFLRQLMGVPRYARIVLKLNPITKKWGFEEKPQWPGSAQAQWGTEDVAVTQIIEAALNSTPVRVFDTIRVPGEGEKRVLNPKATQEAQAKVAALREAWAGNTETGTEGWIWSDDERARRLETLYNGEFNRLVPIKSDGSHLTLPGISAAVVRNGKPVPFELRPHQKNAIWRVITQGNTLFDHTVGAGKTYTMIAAAMEQKRLGLVQRPMVAVPNHMLEQFSSAWLRAYPNAKLLVADKDSTSKDKRKEFAARVAAERWDAIIITHDAFGRIRMSDEAYQNFYREQIFELQDAIDEEVANGDRKKSPTVKQLERMKESLKAKMDALVNKERKDDGIIFEELGVDQVIVDEAHLFKNLQLVTRHNRVKGLGTSASQRATDLFLKIQHIEKSKPGRSAIFATGTPVSNTMAEMYTMQRYLQMGALKQFNIDKFDAWAATFGEITTDLELGTDGRSFQEVTSFSKFVNIPELVQIYSRVADTLTADMLNLPRPTLKGGAPIVVTAEPSAAEEAHMQTLIDRAEAIKSGKVKPDEDNMLAIMTEGRKVATDIRLLMPDEPANPEGKIAKAVENIHRIWQDGKDPALAQIVFLDMGVPGRKRKIADKTSIGEASPESQIESIRKALKDEAAGTDEETAEDNEAAGREESNFFSGDFNLYDEIAGQLVARGVPRGEIAYIHDAKTDEAKAKLFGQVRSGRVRILIGSTGKMGVGTNVQSRLIAMHHIDAPWKPAEVEQRDGRIIRQGNLNKEVEVYRYVTTRSLDAFMWQTLQRKANFIAQLRAGAKGIRVAEDIDNPLPEAAAIKAAASGDPRILEHAELNKELRELEAGKRAQSRSREAARQALAETQKRIALTTSVLAKYEADAARVTDTRGDNFRMILEIAKGKEVADRRKAADAIQAYLWTTSRGQWTSSAVEHEIGTISGFNVVAETKRTSDGMAMRVMIRGEASYGEDGRWYALTENSDLLGVVRRVENMVAEVPVLAQSAKTLVSTLEGDVARLEKQAGAPLAFAKEGRLQEVKGRIAEIEGALKPAKQPEAGQEAVPTDDNSAPLAAQQSLAQAGVEAFIEKKNPPGTDGTLYALATPPRVITEGTARRAVMAAVKAGKAVELGEKQKQALRAVMARMPRILPDGTRSGFVVKVAPNKAGSAKPLRAWFELSDGSTVSLDGTLDSFIGNGAAFLPTRNGSLVLHFVYAPVTEDAVPTLTGRRWHEAIHAIYTAQMFDPATWGLLVGHADSIGVLDMPLRAYLTAIGEDGSGAPNGSLRDAYTKAYKPRMSEVQLQDAIEQESVAIMTELLVMGVDLPLPENIRSILAEIERGEFAGAGTSVSEDMPALAAFGGSLPAGISFKRKSSDSGGTYYDLSARNWYGTRQPIGHAYVRDLGDRVQVGYVGLKPEHQRRGIATALYGQIERDFGKPLVPDSTLSELAYAFWLKHRPEAVAGKYEQSAEHGGWLLKSEETPKQKGAIEGGSQILEQLATLETSGPLFALSGGTIFSKETQEAKTLSRHFGATRIEDIGPNDPHPGRVLAFHGTEADFDQFRIGRALGVHFGTAEQANRIARLYSDQRDDQGNFVPGTGTRLIPAVLDLDNVVDLYDLDNWRPDTVAKEIEFIASELKGLVEAVGAAAPEVKNDVLRNRLIDQGFSGLRYQNRHESDGGWSYIVWEPGKVISATSGNMLFALGGGTVAIDDKVKNIDAIISRIESMPKEQRRPFSDKFDVIVDRQIDRVNYELVPKGKPLWKRNGSPNSVGTFQVKPSGRNEVTGVEVTNASLREEYQRQGIGTKIYDMIESDFADLGGLSPSPRTQLSPIAQSFWSKRLPQGMMFALGGFTPESDIDSSTGQSMRRDLDSLGFYSKALEAARGLKQERGTPEQMMAQLKKAGVKDAEIEATGLADLFREKSGSTTALESDAITLSQNPQQQGDRTASPPRRALLKQITKAEIVKHLEENRVGLREVVRTPQGYDDIREIYRRNSDIQQQAIADARNDPALRRVAREPDETQFLMVLGRIATGGPPSRLTDIRGARRAEYEAARRHVAAIRASREVAQTQTGELGRAQERTTKWEQHSLDPSNPTYRETVIHLPESVSARTAARQEYERYADSMIAKYGERGQFLYEMEDKIPAPERRRLNELSRAMDGANEHNPSFQSGHFPEPNIIGHMMTSMTRHEDKPVYTIDQIQSDWGQRLRDGGVRDEKKLADLKERADKTRAARDDFVRAYQEMLADGDRAKTSLGDANDRLSQLSATGDRYGQEWRRLWNDANIANAEWRTAEAAAVGHPLVNTTDQWTTTTLRRAIRQAVEAGAEYIAIPHGDTVLSYNPGDTNGMRGFYGSRSSEGIVPKNLRKLLGAIDKSAAAPVRVEKLETTRGLQGWQGDNGTAESGRRTTGWESTDATRRDFESTQTGFTLFPLTDSVKRSVMEDGQPMFALGGFRPDPEPAGEGSLDKVIQDLKDTLGVVPTQTLMGVTIRAEDGKEVRLNPQSNVRGQTTSATGAVGVRKSRDVAAIAHESAHYLETTLGSEILDLQTMHAAELAAINPAVSPSEQWAEWFAEYLMNPTAAAVRAPLLHSSVEDVLEANGMLDGIHDVQASYQEWKDRATPEQLSSDVVSVYAGNSFADLKPDGVMETLPAKMAQFYTAAIDSLNPLSKMVKKLLQTADRNGVTDAEGRPISLKVADNPYKLARMFAGSFATGHSWLTRGIANRGETSVAFPPLTKAIEVLYGSNKGSDWQSTQGKAMYQTAGQYLISQRAIVEYDLLEKKEARIEEIDGILEQGQGAWRETSLARQKDQDVLARREDALIRSQARLSDRKRALASAESTLSNLQERIQAKKDDVTAALMARDQALADRRRRDLQILERDSRIALRNAEAMIEEVQKLDVDVGLLSAEIEQLQARIDGHNDRMGEVEDAIAQLRRERESTAKRGGSAKPTAESKEWHQDFIAKVEADPKYARIKEFADLVREFTHGLLTIRHQAGLISDEQFDLLSRRKDYYTPFQRDMTDASAEDVFFKGLGMTKKWSPFKKYDGSDRAIVNPLEVLSQQAYSVAQQIMFNDAVGALSDLGVQAGPGGASIVETMTREESAEANAATFERIRSIAMSMGIDEADANDIVSQMEMNFANQELQFIWSPATKGPIQLPTLPLYRDGERIMVRLTDPEFGAETFNALNGMGKEMSDFWINAAAKPARWLQVGVTTHPTFMPRNLFRDIWDAWIKTGAAPIFTQIEGAKQLYKNGDFLRQYSEAGGIMGGRNIAALTAKEQQTKVLDLADKSFSKASAALGGIAGGLTGTVIGGPVGTAVGAALGATLGGKFNFLPVVEAVESMTRLGVASYAYKRAKEHNPDLTDTEAMLDSAFSARDVFDWNRRGSKMLTMLRLVTFLNAQIQGMDAAFRRLSGDNDRGSALAKQLGIVWRRENGVTLSADEERALGDAYKTMVRMSLYTGLLTALYFLWTSGDDDDKDKKYQDIRDRTKFTHSWLPDIWGTSLRLPKAFEWAVPANMIEALADKIRGRDPRLAERLTMGVYEVLVPPGVPQVLNLAMGVGANVDIRSLNPFAAEGNREIVGDSLQRLDPEAQFDAFSSQLSIDFAKALAASGVPRDMVPSPKKIDFILRTGGYWGQDIAKGYGILREGFGGRPREEPRVSDFPVIGGFTGVAARQSRSRDELFKLMNRSGGKLSTAANTYKDYLDQQGVPDEAARYLANLEPEERAYAILKYHGTPSAARDHPLERLIAIDGAANKLRKDMILDRLTPIRRQGRRQVRDFEEKISLNPRKQTEIHDILERLMQAEAWNTMVLMKRPGWEGRKEFAVQPILDELKASSPEVFDLYEDRLQKTRARSFDDVKQGWPQLRERILREGPGAF